MPEIPYLIETERKNPDLFQPGGVISGDGQVFVRRALQILPDMSPSEKFYAKREYYANEQYFEVFGQYPEEGSPAVIGKCFRDSVRAAAINFAAGVAGVVAAAAHVIHGSAIATSAWLLASPTDTDLPPVANLLRGVSPPETPTAVTPSESCDDCSRVLCPNGHDNAAPDIALNTRPVRINRGQQTSPPPLVIPMVPESRHPGRRRRLPLPPTDSTPPAGIPQPPPQLSHSEPAKQASFIGQPTIFSRSEPLPPSSPMWEFTPPGYVPPTSLPFHPCLRPQPRRYPAECLAWLRLAQATPLLNPLPHMGRPRKGSESIASYVYRREVNRRQSLRDEMWAGAKWHNRIFCIISELTRTWTREERAAVREENAEVDRQRVAREARRQRWLEESQPAPPSVRLVLESVPFVSRSNTAIPATLPRSRRDSSEPQSQHFLEKLRIPKRITYQVNGTESLIMKAEYETPPAAPP